MPVLLDRLSRLREGSPHYHDARAGGAARARGGGRRVRSRAPGVGSPEAIRRIKEISKKYQLPIVIFGHAGDGNLHPNILFDKRDPEQWVKVEQMVAEEFRVALELGGTLSGEHGVGSLKRPYLTQALGPLAIDIQKRIKTALDPNNILNPGKIFPE